MFQRIWLVDELSLTRSEFFARLCQGAFRDRADLLSDDLALVAAATSWALGNAPNTFLHSAFARALDLELLYDSGVFAHQSEATRLHRPDLVQIEDAMMARSRVGVRAAKLLTLQWLKKQEQLPAFLESVDEIIFDSQIDMSDCELAIIFRLAELSQNIRFRLPIDMKERGLLVPSQVLLSKIEARSAHLPVVVELCELPLEAAVKPFFDALFDDAHPIEDLSHVKLCQSSQFASQVDWVCERVAALRAQGEAKIAIAFRTFDHSVAHFEEGLREAGLPYNIHARMPLSELASAKVLVRKLREQAEAEAQAAHKTIAAHLDNAAALVGDDLGRLFLYFSKALFQDEARISTQTFLHWLCALFERREVGFKAHADADCVDLVSVKQLGIRKFDYVFLVDLAEGRFPKTDSPFEALWFVRALTSVQKGLFLSTSTLDPSGREQMPGEFFNAALRVVGHLSHFIKSPSRYFERGTKHDQVGNFQVESVSSHRVFARWLGLNASHPLTPTRLEAFAACPFRGMVEKIFGIEDETRSKNDLDARRVGRFVHAVLEAFFKGDVNPENAREQLAHITAQNKHLLTDDDSQVHKGVVTANVLWLSLVLERAISNLLKDPPVSQVRPKFFEHAFGFKDQSFKIKVLGEELFLGGIVDRIDEGDDAFCIVDYKMSTAMSLRQKTNEKEIFQTHFQLPLYLRLLLEAEPLAREKEVFAYNVSIRDGVASSVLGRDVVRDLKARVSDDEREDGLVFAIKRVMTPIFEGRFEAKKNASCDYCHLKSVCRIREDAALEAEDE